MLSLLKKLHNDEQGSEGLEKLLIIAAIALPLLGLLIFYRNDIGAWVKDKWETVRGTGRTDVGTASGY